MDAFVLDELGIKLPKKDDRAVYAIKLGDLKNRLDAYSNHPRFRKLKDILLNKIFAVELNTLASEIFSGTTPTAGGDAYTEDTSGIPFVRSGEITSDGKVAENIELLLKPDVHDGMMKRSQLKQGDLLIAIVGATIGSVGVYDRNAPANINQAIAGVRLNDKVLPEFICWYLKSSAGQAVLEFLKRPVARANINLEEVGQILVPVPEISLQKKIIIEVEKRRAQAQSLREEAEHEWQGAKENFEKALLDQKGLHE
jgi:type I restriction enzyme S subunit